MSVKDDQVMAVLRAGKAGWSGWVRGECPFCLDRTGKPDRRGSFGIHEGSGRYHCFKCNVSGTLLHVDGARRLGADEERSLPEEMLLPMEFRSLSDPGVMSSSVFSPAFGYLGTRRIGRDAVYDAGLGACLSGQYACRIVVPIRPGGVQREGEYADTSGPILGWVARAWGVSDRPYLYPPKMLRGLLLYNAGALERASDEPVYVVEGVFDALAHWPNAVALLGKPSATQVDALSCAKRPVAVVLDGDAHEEGWALAARLRMAGVRAGSVRLPPRVDPDEVAKDELHRAAERAIETGLARL